MQTWLPSRELKALLPGYTKCAPTLTEDTGVQNSVAQFAIAGGSPGLAKHAHAIWRFTNQWKLMQCSEELFYGILKSIRLTHLYICSQSCSHLFTEDPLSSLTVLSSVVFYPCCFCVTFKELYLLSSCSFFWLSVEMATYLPLFSQKFQKSASLTNLCPEGPKPFLVSG